MTIDPRNLTDNELIRFAHGGELEKGLNAAWQREIVERLEKKTHAGSVTVKTDTQQKRLFP